MKRLHFLPIGHRLDRWIYRRALLFLACALIPSLGLMGCAQTPPPQANSVPVVTPQAEVKKPTQPLPSGTSVAVQPVEPVVRAVPAPAEVKVQPAPQLSPPSGIEGQPTRVGLLLPLSGNQGAAQLGQAMLNAAMLALFDIGGDRLLLMPRDTSGTPEDAERAAAELVGEGAEIILGPLFNTSVEATAAVTRARGLPMIAFSSDRRVAGDGVFILSFTPSQEVNTVVGYAAAQGLRRFAVLVPEDPYGQAVLEAAQEAAIRYGVELAQTEFYAANGDGLDESVKRLADYYARRQALLARRKELREREDETAKRMLEALENHDTLGDLDYDAVLLPEGGELLKSLAPLLPYYDIDTSEIRLLGTGRWDDPKVRLEPALLGGWFAGADRSATAGFQERYRATFGTPPPRLASLAYDAMALAAVLAQEPGGPDFSVRAITSPDGFVGSDGIFRFGPDGVAERGMAVLEIERSGFRVRRKAPTTFEALSN